MKHRESHLAYYERPDVRQKIRDRHNGKPEVIARREARLAWRKERADYRASDQFKAVLKERNRKNWLKRKSLGKTREHDRKKWRENLQHRLASNMRRLVHSALTRMTTIRKCSRTFDLIGCSVSALKVHLETQFIESMSWENYGSSWHVDHRIPLALFDLSDAGQQRAAFHFENLRPLWKSANHQKSDRVIVDGKEVRARDIRKIVPFKAA